MLKKIKKITSLKLGKKNACVVYFMYISSLPVHLFAHNIFSHTRV